MFFYRYTRNLVDTGNEKYNLMALCWGEGHGSSIHDHSGSHCFVKMLDGSLKETLFEWPAHPENDEPLTMKSERIFEKNAVSYMSGMLTDLTSFSERFSDVVNSFSVFF